MFLARFPFITLPPFDQILDEGEPLFIECQALGLPPLSIVLRKDGASIFPFAPVLMVSSATDEDAGNYTCLASNSLGMVISDVALIRVRCKCITYQGFIQREEVGGYCYI